MLSPGDTPSAWDLLLDLYPVFLAPQNFPAPQKVPSPASQRLDKAVSALKVELASAQTEHQSIKIDHRNPNVPEVRDLHSAVEGLAEDLETLIDPESKLDSCHSLTIGSGPSPSYPKLSLLRNVFLNSKPPVDDISDNLEHTDDRNNTSSAHIIRSSASTTSTRGIEAHAARAAHFIGFPQDLPGINLLKSVFTRFLLDIKKASFRSRVQESTFTDQECGIIDQAYKCSSSTTLLFSHLVRETACGAHQAKLDLSGVRGGQLKMMVRKCQDTTTESWLPAVFTHSTETPPSGISAFRNICSSTENPEPIRAFFDSDTMWPSSEDAGSNPLTVPPTETSLRDFLNGVPPAESGLPKPELDRRSQVGFLLAAAFFQLCGSPWLKEPFQAEHVFVSVTNDQPPGQWHLHTPCDLVRSTEATSLNDNVAALGVLILELETGSEALWTTADGKSRAGSHRRRLRRLLHEWKGNIVGENKRIAHVCLDFETLLASFEDTNMSLGKKMPAFIYKHILRPIVRRNAERFEELRNVSTAIFGPCLPSFSNIVPPKPLAFLDAEDQPLNMDALSKSKKFFDSAEPFLKCVEKIPRDSGKRKKTIVLLDTGVDLGHIVISQAVKHGHINTEESKSFVGSPRHQDDDMHGTHVAELTTRVAPIAQIIIGKILERRENVSGMLERLAEAIDWAAKEKKADIICLSLGYRTVHAAADRAVDNAIKAGVLVIAAASNSGILERRARPACLDGVIAVHAANGYGCASDMNPGRLKDETNFSTLGERVHVLEKGKNELKSGTSYAAPIAAGFIACILDFVEAKVPGLSDLQVEKLKRKKGMEAVLKTMSKKDHREYDYIHPEFMCTWPGPDEVQSAGPDELQSAVYRVVEALRDV